jgi:hypothetical protein
MCRCYLRSCTLLFMLYLFIYFNILPFLFFVFLVIWLLTTFKCTNPSSFVSAPSPLHFCSESMIRYIRSQIRIRSLSTPFLIRQKRMVEDMVKEKSNGYLRHKLLMICHLKEKPLIYHR